jgi:hypothetical protein
MPIKAIIPNAIIETVIPVLSLFERTVFHDKARISMKVIKVFHPEIRKAAAINKCSDKVVSTFTTTSLGRVTMKRA